MPAERPAIPRELKHRILVEAGHRCAIPTCRQHPVDIEHIEDWASAKEHAFENLIALCPTCHRRKGDGPNQIDRKSLRQYKANLAVLNSRYGEFERRLIEWYSDHLRAVAPSGVDSEPRVKIPFGAGGDLHLMYLIRDGYLRRVDSHVSLKIHGVPVLEDYEFTDAGTEFVKRWADAQPLNPPNEDEQ